ncbi:MAG: SipW-dependent-type signal peptide-containing protein [Candidatus Moranbacteria bacterium]|nr:SipW-dependent-type signal peptide-containing protein [bacterium]MDP1833928.1 SipW-dependent-type signal peptide-containing protein [Candidatus Moranbacteria bacterium]
MMKILKSLAIVIAIAAIAGGASYSFFSDTEMSAGNMFTAGVINLKIDNSSYAIDSVIPGFDDPVGDLVASPHNTWSYDNLTDQLFFNFEDLKPGDIGEDTIGLQVSSNDAWACMKVDITDTPENDLIDPEAEAGDKTEKNGELQDELSFAFWADDGDNVYEDEEVTLDDGNPGIFLEGKAADIFKNKFITLADSMADVWPGGNGRPIIAGENYYIAKVWCFGKLTPAPVSSGDGDPLHRGTGFLCDGDSVSSASQTDGIKADVTFYSEQARNNPHFVCNQQECLADTVYTSEVESNVQGTLNDGTPVIDPDRTDPSEANGPPDWVSGTGTNFYSLGKGGTVTLKFADVVGNGNGNDLAVYEATNGRDSYPLESADVEVSLNGKAWYPVGIATSEPGGDGVSYFDISSTPLSMFKYVRLTDSTDFSLHNSISDGFDLDAVGGVYGECE